MKMTNQDDESEILQGYYGFSSIIRLGGCGGPEKDRVLWSSLYFTIFLHGSILPTGYLLAVW